MIKPVTKKELRNKFFHHEHKDCRLKLKRDVKYVRQGHRTVADRATYFWCNTHRVQVCKCGWQFGYHYGKKAC